MRLFFFFMCKHIDHNGFNPANRRFHSQTNVKAHLVSCPPLCSSIINYLIPLQPEDYGSANGRHVSLGFFPLSVLRATLTQQSWSSCCPCNTIIFEKLCSEELTLEITTEYIPGSFLIKMDQNHHFILG